MEKMLFQFEMKKVFSQTSTKVIAVVLFLFPMILVAGLVAPTDQFSVSIAEYKTNADFGNQVLGYLCLIGFHYIILAILSSSILSREIESKYLYFTLSVVPNATKLFFYKAFVVSIIYTAMLAVSSITGYIVYSLFYIKELSFSSETFVILGWGIFITFIIVLIYMMMLTICNILTDGSVFASLTMAIVTMVVLIVLGGIQKIRDFHPAWQADYGEDRNYLFLFLVYLAVLSITSFLVYLCSKKKRV
ncbi:hypothetical protein SAMN02745116_02354 [Pilibacter termitis]|uniref:Uncharacterized protein n=1 Tax=Pilibacter termitis TaxID=263852 RepID=A0A1T4QX31_9ENTE|nr:hypothetical protein [Pilibacter termitis]SKA08323.1 hypothetical protein SAMN02745116_02354 [Pilibacter termitis]